jgi:hypothetical protein
MAPETDEVSLRSPPAERWVDRLRRRWRSRGRHRNLQFWLLFRGSPFVAVLVCLYVVNGLVIGWSAAYDVMLGITSPADTSAPAPAWVLSVAGWLVTPAVVGAVAGYVISSQITSRRRRPIDQLFREDADD